MKVTPDKDGTIKSLPLGTQLGNALLALALPWNNPLIFSACVQWLINTYRANKQGRFQWPVTIEIFNFLTGMSCAEISKILRAYGIATQTTSLFVELWPNHHGIGIRKTFWVPRSQAAMADAILRQYAGNHYMVCSPHLGNRGKFGKPWGVPAKPRSWDEAVVDMMYGFFDNQVTARVATGETEREQKPLKQTADKRRATGGRGRRLTKSQPVWKKVSKALW